MRILYIGLNQTGVGTYWRMFHFARHIVQSGHTVTIISMSPQRRFGRRSFVEQGVEIVETPDLLWGALRSGWDIGETVNRIGWIKQHDFDLIHAFETRPTVLFPALYGRYVRRIPLFFDWCDWFGRNGAVEERPSRLQRLLLRHIETFFEEGFRHHALGTTVICEKLRQNVLRMGLAESTIELIRDGCDVNELRLLDKYHSRQSLGLSLQDPIIGYVGSIFQRDADLLAQSFDRLQELCPATKLLLIGYVNRPIRHMVGHPDSVIETKRIPYGQISQYIAACDVCWLPYVDSDANRGRWPMKLNDYMAVGRPTVATAVGDVATVMRQYEIGLLTEPTSQAIASATAQLLANVNQQIILGQSARLVAEQHFAWKKLSKQMLDFYEQRLGSVKSIGCIQS